MGAWNWMSGGGSGLDQVTGSPAGLTLGQRVLNAATFCTTAATGLNFSVDLLTAQPTGIRLISSTAFVAFGLLHVAGRRRWLLRWLPALFTLVAFAFLLAEWWVLGDVAGSTLVVFMGLAGVLPMILAGLPRLLLLLALNAVLMVMVRIQLVDPDILPLMSREKALQDTLVTAVLLGAGLSALVSLLVLSHRREQERVEAASRHLGELNLALEERNRELDAALQEIQVLQGIIPICSWCKKIRNDEGYFEAVEAYISRRSAVRFSHTLCPDCVQQHYSDLTPPPDPARG